MAKTVAQKLVDELVNAGVKRIYGIVGDSLNPVSNALREDGRLQFVHVRHEEAGAFAASAEAQLTGGLAVCAGSSGPGHVHLINGLYDAQRSYAPVLAIASTIPTAETGMRYFQSTHPETLFRDCSEFCETVVSPAQMPRLLQNAMQTAISRRCVAVLALPGDVAAMRLDDLTQTRPVFQTREAIRPDDDVLDGFAAAINAAKRPLFFCGDGCRDAHAPLLALAQKLKAPVGHTLRGKQWVQADNPFDTGMTGLLGFGGFTQAVRECDLMVIAGADFPYDVWYPSGVPILQIDRRGENIGRRAPVRLGAVGDVSQTFSALLPRVRPRDDDAFLGKALAHTRASFAKLHAYVDAAGAREKLHPEYATALIDRLAPRDAVFTVDTGLSTVWGARYLTAMKDRRIIGSFSHGSMACGVPMAIGAQLAYPKRCVAALVGDGALAMLMGDLLTLVQYDLPVKVFVYNNGTLGFINLEMLAAGYGGGFATSLKNPNFADMAASIGMKGVRVTSNAEAEESIRGAFALEGPVLVDLTTDPNAVAIPPEISLSMAANFSLGLSRMALMGNLDDTLSIIRSAAKAL